MAALDNLISSVIYVTGLNVLSKYPRALYGGGRSAFVR